jgi:hypothetical protein
VKQIPLAELGIVVNNHMRGIFFAVCHAHGVMVEETGTSTTLTLYKNTVFIDLFERLQICLIVPDEEVRELLRDELADIDDDEFVEELTTEAD